VLAAASLAAMLPGVLLGPFIGALVDRGNRRIIMVLADGIAALGALTVLIVFSSGVLQVWHIYLVMFIRSVAGNFHTHAMTASTSLMVPVEGLTRIQGLNQMLQGGVNLAAAPLGAVLLSLFSLQGVLLIDVATALTAVVPLIFYSVPRPRRPAPETETSGARKTGLPGLGEDLRKGLRYIRSWPALMLVGLGTVGINFTVIPAFSLLPLLVRDHLGGGAFLLGGIESAMGGGIIAGGALLGAWGGFRRRIMTSLTGLLGMGAGILTLALVPAEGMAVAAGAVFLVGAMNSLTMGPFVALIQTRVEPAMQARVLSLMSSAGTLMVPLGLAVAGPVADHFGIQAWFFGGGVLCLLMGILGLIFPMVRKMEERKDRKSSGCRGSALSPQIVTQE
jgi:MFS transporter, DHA3 family, macrolide efflux protein